MILFTKQLCSACQDIEKLFNLEALGVEVQELGSDNIDGLAALVWYELVETVEKNGLPILVVDEDTVITDSVEIKDYLSNVN